MRARVGRVPVYGRLDVKVIGNVIEDLLRIRTIGLPCLKGDVQRERNVVVY